MWIVTGDGIQHQGAVGHIAGQPQAAYIARGLRRRIAIEIEQRHFGALGGEGPGGGGADAVLRARDQRNASG